VIGGVLGGVLLEADECGGKWRFGFGPARYLRFEVGNGEEKTLLAEDGQAVAPRVAYGRV